MSGHLTTIPIWTLDQHEKHYRALLSHLHIDPTTDGSFEQHRAKSQDEITSATLTVAGTYVATGKPCAAGVFYAESAFGIVKIRSPPRSLKGYMIGDILHESMTFVESFDGETFDTGSILSVLEFMDRMEKLTSDVFFRLQTWIPLRRSTVPQTYTCHFDRVSKIPGDPFEGKAYSALDLLYIFPNTEEMLSPSEVQLSHTIADHWIDFAHREEPWEGYENGHWMRYGPNDEVKVVTEQEDESTPSYTRMQEVTDLGVADQLMMALDDIVVKRYRIGTGWQTPKRNEAGCE
ncbi:hypothetical protein AbraIFM66950_005816 [Aspergillus brasiliensis]|nr:hypothetical protein AbraIFM66950_005816 [Aspergillus brasiliensis]